VTRLIRCCGTPLPQVLDLSVVTTVAAGGGASASVDLMTRRVPNILTLSITAVGFALAASNGRIAGACGGFALGLLLMLPGHFIGATGAGDVKLFAALGTLLGPGPIATAFFYTALAGGGLAGLGA